MNRTVPKTTMTGTATSKTSTMISQTAKREIGLLTLFAVQTSFYIADLFRFLRSNATATITKVTATAGKAIV
jgi:hypothetical protein